MWNPSKIIINHLIFWKTTKTYFIVELLNPCSCQQRQNSWLIFPPTSRNFGYIGTSPLTGQPISYRNILSIIIIMSCRMIPFLGSLCSHYSRHFFFTGTPEPVQWHILYSAWLRVVFLTLEFHKYSACAWKMEEISVHIQKVISYSVTVINGYKY